MNSITFSLIGKSAYINKNQTNTKTLSYLYSKQINDKISFGDDVDVYDLDTSLEGQLQRFLKINPDKDSLPVVKLKTYRTFNLPMGDLIEELLRDKKSVKEIEDFLRKLNEIEEQIGGPDCDDD